MNENDTVFSRLIIGIPDVKKLVYMGAFGTGFTDRSYGERY
jgi:hypothetical protein